MRVLLTWGSKRGGTEGIARMIGDELQARGYEVVALSAEKVTSLEGIDAVIVGGALYANRWPLNARRFLSRNVRALRRVPVWIFSSGPLDASADRETLAAPTQVAVLAERVGARAHVTFGGRLEPDAKGFPASAMAKTSSGDWRNPARVREWAAALAAELPAATPGHAIDHPAHGVGRWLGHGAMGWAACATLLFAADEILGATPALVLHALAVPVVFALTASRYFGARGARDPLPTALAWTALVAGLYALMAAAMQRTADVFTSIAATWLPFALVFVTTWNTGLVFSTMPWPKGPANTKGTRADTEPQSAHS